MSWIIPLIAPLVVTLLSIFFPFKASQGKAAVDFNTLHLKYQKWELFALIPLFVFVPLMAFLFGELFLNLYKLLAVVKEDTLYLIQQEEDAWFVVGGIFSFGLIGFPMTFLYQILLKDKYQEYTLYTNIKHGFDGFKIFKPMAWTFCFIATILLFLITDYYIVVNNEKIVLNELSSLSEKSYHFNEIESIHFIENIRSGDGSVVNTMPHYVVDFKDHTSWNTAQVPEKDKQKEIMIFLAQKINHKIDTLSFDPG
jgi:hypothetical protein